MAIVDQLGQTSRAVRHDTNAGRESLRNHAGAGLLRRGRHGKNVELMQHIGDIGGPFSHLDAQAGGQRVDRALITRIGEQRRPGDRESQIGSAGEQADGYEKIQVPFLRRDTPDQTYA